MSNFEQQMHELNADIEEMKRLVGQASRSRVKQALELQQRRFETELTNLKEKQEKAGATASTTEKKPSATAAPTRSYTKEITDYAWDQSDKFVQIYLQNLSGVGSLPADQVRCTFEPRGFALEILNLNGVNYSFKRSRLLHEIKPETSNFKVKKDMIVLNLAKAENKQWECVFQDEKKTNEKPLPKMDEAKDPGDSLMQMMKNMYETGDDEMKRTIAKAWTESREKMRTGDEDNLGF